MNEKTPQNPDHSNRSNGANRSDQHHSDTTPYPADLSPTTPLPDRTNPAATDPAASASDLATSASVPAASEAHAPERPQSDASTAGVGGAAGAATPGAGSRAERAKRFLSRPWAIGVGAAVAVLLIGGAGIGIGHAISDHDDDDDRGDHSQVSESGGSDSRADSSEADESNRGDGEDGDRQDGDARNGESDDRQEGDRESGGTASALAPADTKSLVDAIDAAVAEVKGTGATSIDVEHDGWEVDVALKDGKEAEVHVALDGTATVRETGNGDSDPLLDTKRVAAIAAAAVKAAGGGTVESISTESGATRYEVSVRLSDGHDVDVELGEKLDVRAVDND
ncbi:MAG: hypothetical protein ACK5LO_02705 [Leucobacter sp.]